MSRAITTSAPQARGQGLALERVDFAYDDADVLSEVTLSVARGETVAVIGPSGTGKTTLLRLLALFESPTHGSVRIAGTNAWEVDERTRLAARRRLAMVFQTPNLFDASVGRNVAYGRHIRKDWTERVFDWKDRLLEDELDGIHREALDTVEMQDAADQPAETLSGGEAQRVAFARAIACAPECLLLDEPTSDLDPRNTAIIENAIDAAKADGMGIVVATHDMHQAERIADRVAVMIDGTIVEVGSTDRIFASPTDDRVRQFIEGELVY